VEIQNIEETWEVKCYSCGEKYTTLASSEAEAIEKAKEEHRERNSKARAYPCDLGPDMQVASRYKY